MSLVGFGRDAVQDMEKAEKVMKALQARGLDFMLGMDTGRLWATGAQSFVNADQTIIVFREQNMVNSEGGEDFEILLKNVVSVVIPTEVARALRDQLTEAFTVLESGQSGNQS